MRNKHRRNIPALFLLTALISSCITTMSANSTEIGYQYHNNMTTKQHYELEIGVVLKESCEDGSNLIEKMCSAAAELNNYSADYKMLVHKGEQIITEAGTIYFRKPKLFRVEVKEGPKTGAVAILRSDGKVYGHLGGVMKYFWSSVAPDSSFARALNGFPMAYSDFYSLADYLKNMLKQGDMSKSTVEPVQTAKIREPIYVVDIYRSKSENAVKTPLLLKRIYVDPKTYFPLYWDDYVDGSLWSESSWNDLRSNLPLANTLFVH